MVKITKKRLVLMENCIPSKANDKSLERLKLWSKILIPILKKSDFTLNPLKFETFEVAFKDKLISILPQDASERIDDPNKKRELTAIARNVFFNIVAETLKESLSDAPVSGKLTIASKLNIYNGVDSLNTRLKVATMRVKDVEIEFYEGYIETIKVNGEIVDTISSTSRLKTKKKKLKIEKDKIYPKGSIRFENKYGIGFSTRSNYAKLVRQNLYEAKNKSGNYIILDDLLDYDYNVRPMTRDFSPANQVITSYGGQKLDLHKEERSKLFEAVVFSDFLGFDQDNPNGLIQTEIAKRVNLNSDRYSFGRYASKLAQAYGFFQYMRPAITISKIEENNRFLQPETNDMIINNEEGEDVLVQGISTSRIDVLYYQNLSVGLDLNVLFLDSPHMKYHIYANAGFRFGRTVVQDSLRTLDTGNNIVNSGFVNEFGINYFTLYPEIIVQLLPEERFSFFISDRLQYFSSAFDKPELITINKDGVEDEKASDWINSFEMMVYVKVGQNGKLFGRWVFNSQLGNIQENFHQLQLGYSFYILKNN